MDTSLEDDALDLGCTQLQTFFKITLPNISSGIFTGMVMVFTLSLDDFVISYFVYGADYSTLPIEIYNYTKKPVTPTIYALFTMMFLAILLLMIIMNVVQARNEKKKNARMAQLYERI